MSLLHMMTTSNQPTSTKNPLSVGIIGAGAAGLAVARVLSRNGITDLTVLEQDNDQGGVWRYDEEEKQNTSSNARCRPMYRGLRTNLPRQVMQFREFPWEQPPGCDDDTKDSSYVTHQQVQKYLCDYANEYELRRFIRYGCRVSQLTMLKEDGGVSLQWQQEEHSQEQSFDLVCVCNGHYAAPARPRIPGLAEHFTGTVMHAADYDTPREVAQDRVVLCVGARASGSDLAREMAAHAKHVYVSDGDCGEAAEDARTDHKDRGLVTRVPRTRRVDPGGIIRLGTGKNNVSLSDVDVIVFCSGYDYSFPFVNDRSHLDLKVIPGERRVSPLYEQLWHARWPHRLAFVGLPHSVVPFPLFELQAEAIARELLVLGGSSSLLPTEQERLEAAERDRIGGGPQGKRVQDTHFLGNYQWDYCRRMATLSGQGDDEWLDKYIQTNQDIYDHSGSERKGLIPGGPDVYRETRYARNHETQQFRVVHSPFEQPVVHIMEEKKEEKEVLATES